MHPSKLVPAFRARALAETTAAAEAALGPQKKPAPKRGKDGRFVAAKRKAKKKGK